MVTIINDACEEEILGNFIHTEFFLEVALTISVVHFLVLDVFTVGGVSL
jgi:hypothetical protein